MDFEQLSYWSSYSMSSSEDDEKDFHTLSNMSPFEVLMEDEEFTNRIDDTWSDDMWTDFDQYIHNYDQVDRSKNDFERLFDEEKEKVEKEEKVLPPPKRSNKRRNKRKLSSGSCTDDSSSSSSSDEITNDPIPKKKSKKNQNLEYKRYETNMKYKNIKREKIPVFLAKLIDNNYYNPSVLKWIDEDKGIFKVTNKEELARLWAKATQNDKMTYDKLSRAIRYHNKSTYDFIHDSRKLVYRFGEAFTTWRNNYLKRKK